MGRTIKIANMDGVAAVRGKKMPTNEAGYPLFSSQYAPRGRQLSFSRALYSAKRPSKAQ